MSTKRHALRVNQPQIDLKNSKKTMVQKGKERLLLLNQFRRTTAKTRKRRSGNKLLNNLKNLRGWKVSYSARRQMKFSTKM